MSKQSAVAGEQSAAKTRRPWRTSPVTLVRRHLKARQLGKQKYGTADFWLERLLTVVKPGDFIEVDGVKYQLVDLYEHKNKVYRQHGIGRYEVQPVKEKKASDRAKD